jgi:hypothetical protein
LARQSITPNPSLKLFEAYMDFSGGLNSEQSNERLRDNEFITLDNVDLSSRGSAKRRTGRVLLNTQTGRGQGLFYYYRQGQSKPDIILAIGGALYVRENGSTTLKPITIVDGAGTLTFQATQNINAVQYGISMFVATGTKLCELSYDTSPAWAPSTVYAVNAMVNANGLIYTCTVAGTSGTVAPTHTSGIATDGTVTWQYTSQVWNAKVVDPYKPTVQEAIFIGTNGLAASPDAYVQDGTDTALAVAGIKPSRRTGVVNAKTTMTGYINKPSGMGGIDYKWEYKKSADSTWVLGRDFTADTSGGKTWDFTPDTAVNYDIRLTVRATGTSTPTPNSSLTNYVVNKTEDKLNTPKPVSGIQTCRKILLHWDRLILSGDSSNPYQMYISDLNAPRYFPTTNTISFDTGKLEPITAITRFRDMLVIFTKTTIQTLSGKSPDDYRHSLIHDGIGCVASRSAAVAGNVVIFLSSEGLHLLKPNALTLEVMNVARIDFPIRSAIASLVKLSATVTDGSYSGSYGASDACAMVYDSQYWLCFPSSQVVYRFYYDGNMWVRDTSSRLTFNQMSNYGDDIYELSVGGKLYQQDKTVWTDDGEVYPVTVESKAFDLSASFNFKKLKRVYMLGKHFQTTNTNLKVTITADSAIVMTPETGQAQVIDDRAVWITTSTPNMHFYTGTTVGSWILSKIPLGNVQVSVQKASIRGKCRRVKVKIVHDENTPCEVFGFGLEFKEKRP